MNRSKINFIFVLTILLFCGLQTALGGDRISGDGEGNRIVTSLRLKLEVLAQMILPANPLQLSNRQEESIVIPFSDEDFVEIPSKGASFMMGSPRDEKDRSYDERGRGGEPTMVKFDYSFAMMRTEVTQAHWTLVTNENPAQFQMRKYCQSDYRLEAMDYGNVSICPYNPVESVSWKQIRKFIKKLNKQEGLKNCEKQTPKEAVGCYRLPTEAEWEFAARGGTTTVYSFGDDPHDLGGYSWYLLNSGRQTHAVGLKHANPFGLFDMHGNVWEWVMDKYRDFLPGGDNPLYTGRGSKRVIRGGGWGSNWSMSEREVYLQLRSAKRLSETPGSTRPDIGFRLVKTL